MKTNDRPAGREVSHMLQWASQRGLDRLDAQLLLAHQLQCNRSWLLAHDDHHLSDEQAHGFEHLVERRSLGEPIAYLLQTKEFFGLTLKVSPSVLVPRPDTETLVQWALDVLRVRAPGQRRVLDLGTGSGAIALAIQYQQADAQVTATDISSDALAVAAHNARALGLPIRLHQGDWLSFAAQASAERFDLIVSNPPYIDADDPHLPALSFEPRGALVSGNHGLADLDTIIAQARQHLSDNAWLLLEHGHTQHLAVQALLRSAGFAHVSTRHDLGGNPRCTGGCWPGSPALFNQAPK